MTDGGLFVEERKQEILEYIEARKKATVSELCEQFRVSSATIRNDLRDLEAGALLIRTHGGAMVKSKTGLELARMLNRNRGLTVVTNDLPIALLLEELDTVSVVFIGGILRRRFHCTMAYGKGWRELLTGLTVDKAFMGVNSLSLEKGATTPDVVHAERQESGWSKWP